MGLSLTMDMSMRGGLGRTGTSGVVNPFLASAQKIMAINASPRTLTSSALSIDISNTGNSTINGRSFAAGGIVPTASIPDGQSGPLNANSKWIITKPPATQTAANLTFAPGNSKIFMFSGQKFDFKAGLNSGVSFTIRWSTDNGLTWKQSPQTVCTVNCWCLIDFGAPLGVNGVVEVIGDDESFQTFGFNFDTGSSAPAAFVDTALPTGLLFGDSFVFGSGSRTDGIANDQRASIAMCRKMAETIGSLQAYNHGFRTNGFSNDHSGVQSKFKDRILDPVDGTLSEGNHWGAVDYFTISSSINDDTSSGPTLLADATAAFQNIRTLQPNALIVMVCGARSPDLTESALWVTSYLNAFKAVFGSTSAQWVANGAYFVDGSRTSGANWTPAGAVGSSPYFEPATNVNADTIHPNAAGHAYLGQKYGQGVVDLANLILGAVQLRVTTAGDTRVTTTGDTRRVA